MILYPFQPDLPFGYSVAGFDEEKKTPGAELYLLPPGVFFSSSKPATL